MILLAALLASPLATGCRRLERSVLCELAPPVRAAPPPKPTAEAATTPPVRHPPRSAPRPAAKPAPPPKPPTDAEIAHHVEALVAIADCTGARTLLVSSGHGATADSTYRACIGLPAAQAGLPPETALGGESGAGPK